MKKSAIWISVLLVGLPSVLAAGFLAWSVAEEERAAQREIVEEKSRLEGDLRRESQQMDGVLRVVVEAIHQFGSLELARPPIRILASTSEEALSDLQEAARRERERFISFLHRGLESELLDFLVITDNRGTAVFVLGREGTAFGGDWTSHSLIRAGLNKEGRTAVRIESKEHLSLPGGQPLFAVEAARPLMAQETLTGVALAGRFWRPTPREGTRIAFFSAGGTPVRASPGFPQEAWSRARPGEETVLAGREALSSLLLRDEAGRPAGSVGLARRVSPPWQLLPALGAALLLVFSGILSAAVFWVRWRRRIRSLLRLIETSEQMSLGTLHSRVETGSNGEMRILAESLERLRISLKTALEKLRQRSQ
ncbi:MAG: hypothetical protein HY652_15785 [Acidobacteria bacterium]|nr:hypothetical protein [Acidobacteriota bacterium]